MEKYKCIMCDTKFWKNKDAMYHVNIYKDHVIVEKPIKRRLLDFLLSLNWKHNCRIIGCIMISITLLNHFNVELTQLESVLIGIGFGLII